MSIPNELVQGIVDIKTAIENKSADTPVDIPDREYPDELCEALGAVKDAIEDSESGSSITRYKGKIKITNGYNYTVTLYTNFIVADKEDFAEYGYTKSQGISKQATGTFSNVALIDGKAYICGQSGVVSNMVGCTVSKDNIGGSGRIIVTPDNDTECSFTLALS